jgi:hypothetical protein
MPWTKRIDASLIPVLAVPKYRSRKVDNFELEPSLWSSAAERIKHDRTLAGDFIVSSNGYAFCHAHRSLSISAAVVTHVFLFETNGIQLFTSDFRQFLFRFPGQSLSRIITELRQIDLPNAVFFQTSDPTTEAEGLLLVQRWQASRLSSLDYLIWVNHLFGRSFLSLECPLLLPDASASVGDFVAKHFPSLSPTAISRGSAVPFPGDVLEPTTIRLPARPLTLELFGDSAATARVIAVTEQGRVLECRPGQPPRELATGLLTRLVAFNCHSVVFRAPSGLSLIEINLTKLTRTEGLPGISPITALAASASITVTGAVDGSITVWRGVDPIETLFAYSGPVLALAVSPALGVVASAGRDGAIVLAMVPGLVWLRKIDTAARQIAIAGSWIVAVGSGERGAIRSFGVNGEDGAKVETECPTLDLCTVVPRSGGEFVAIVGRNGKVSVHEAGGLKRVAVIGDGANIVRCRTELGVIAVADDRTVTMYPFPGDALNAGLDACTCLARM